MTSGENQNLSNISSRLAIITTGEVGNRWGVGSRNRIIVGEKSDNFRVWHMDSHNNQTELYAFAFEVPASKTTSENGSNTTSYKFVRNNIDQDGLEVSSSAVQISDSSNVNRPAEEIFVFSKPAQAINKCILQHCSTQKYVAVENDSLVLKSNINNAGNINIHLK